MSVCERRHAMYILEGREIRYTLLLLLLLGRQERAVPCQVVFLDHLPMRQYKELSPQVPRPDLVREQS